MSIDETLTASRIIGLFGEKHEGFERFDRLMQSAPASHLISALRRASDARTRQVLCDILGFRAVKSAIPALIECLDDSDDHVRGAAADSLGKACGYVKVPPPPQRRQQVLEALLRRWDVEDSDAVRSTMTQTLALVGDPSVIPLLRSVLDHPDDRVRRQARWGLDYLAEKGHQ